MKSILVVSPQGMISYGIFLTFCIDGGKRNEKKSILRIRAHKGFFNLYLMWNFAVFCLSKSHGDSKFNEIIWCIIIICKCDYQLWLILLLLRSSNGCYFSLLAGICVTFTLWTLTRTTAEGRGKQMECLE